MDDPTQELRNALERLRGGDAAGAIAMLRALLRGSPGFAPARQLLGIALMEIGRPREALVELDAVASAMPSPQLQFNRGNALLSCGRREQALEAYAAALAMQPDFQPALVNSVHALRALGHDEEALAACERLVSLAPERAEAWQLLGSLRLQLVRDTEAIAAFDRALALEPRLPIALNERGVARHRLGDPVSALADFEAALALQPSDADALNNRGNALHDLRQMEPALRCFDAALALRPEFPEAACNRGMVLQDLGRFDEADAAYRRALRLRRPYPEALQRRAALSLLLGRFTEGWADYEKAHALAAADPAPARQWWRGEPLAGKSILLTEPNGIGDTLQFLRFVPRLFEAGAREVAFAGPPRFRRLLSGFDPRLQLVDEGSGRYDYHSWLWSLPHWLGIGAAVAPPVMPYLHAEPERVARWSGTLDPAYINIGITWQGNPARRIDRSRSIPLAEFAPLSRLPGVRLLSLQKNFGLEQLRALPEGMQVSDPGADFDEGPDAFLDTAALVQGLDLVVSVDSSLTHLAGALDRPVWLALNPVPEWRWQLGREDSPWYPSVRLFRQQAGEGWSPVFARMAQALDATLPALRAARSR